MNFNVTVQEKLTNGVSGSTLQLNFEKSTLAELGWTIREYPQQSEKAIKIMFPFPVTCVYETGFFFLYFNHTTYRNRLSAEADLKIQPSSIFFYQRGRERERDGGRGRGREREYSYLLVRQTLNTFVAVWDNASLLTKLCLAIQFLFTKGCDLRKHVMSSLLLLFFRCLFL